jgi:hypothetical protein
MKKELDDNFFEEYSKKFPPTSNNQSSNPQIIEELEKPKIIGINYEITPPEDSGFSAWTCRVKNGFYTTKNGKTLSFNRNWFEKKGNKVEIEEIIVQMKPTDWEKLTGETL